MLRYLLQERKRKTDHYYYIITHLNGK